MGFAATLNGSNQNISAAQPLDVQDNTGTGAGWNVTLTTTTWTAGALSLATTSTSDLSAAGACDTSVTCTVKIQTSALNSGLGNQTWTHSMQLAIPANAKAGAYTSTWTYSLVSAP